MKTIGVADLGTLKNELRKYKHGRKLDIRQFNQAARLAWLGLLTLSPLDPEDPECRAWLLHLERPSGVAARILTLDEDLLGRIHVLDAGLERRDFYLAKFFRPGGES